MSKLLISGRHLFYSPALAAKIGRTEATLLQQAYYWMSTSGGKIINGIKWFWKTYQKWSEELQLSVSTIRRAVGNLKKLGLIAVDRLSAKTYYQANWYTIKIEALSAFIQNEQIELLNSDTSICSERANHIKDFSPEEFSTQQQAAGEKTFLEENSETLTPDVTTSEQTVEQTIDTSKPSNVEQSTLTEQTIDTSKPSNVEQSTLTHCVEEQNQDCSSKEPETHSDTLSADVEETIDEPVEKPSQQEIREICNQLRQVPCTPSFRFSQEMMAVINKFWQNVPGALAYLKEALRTWKRVDSPEAVFVAACKDGRKPQNWSKPSPTHPQPSDEDLAQLAQAKLTGRIRDYYHQPDGMWVVDTGSQCVGWCHFFST
ncbi:MAG: ArsR family transcriptional regulator [Iphinoe sp. HA4291-MV1]|jgi:hypothetical protein|nr:ArsR family transcriptional regulator [Iphinoe sp. HA4291-MV1]